MKAVAETIGVARSHLHDKVRRPRSRAVHIANPRTRTCCSWSAAWSTSARPTAIAGSRRWPTGSWPEPASRQSTTSASSASCGRTACCLPGTRAAGPAVSTTARSSSCARTCAGARMASRSPAGTATSSGSPSSSMPMTARSSPGMPSSARHQRQHGPRHDAGGRREPVRRPPGADAARMADRQWQRLHGQGDARLRRPRSISFLASRPSKARNRTAYPRASSKPSSATMFASILAGCGHRAPADRRMVRGLQREPSSLRAQNALPKGVHQSTNSIADCPVKQGQLQNCFTASARRSDRP